MNIRNIEEIWPLVGHLKEYVLKLDDNCKELGNLVYHDEPQGSLKQISSSNSVGTEISKLLYFWSSPGIFQTVVIFCNSSVMCEDRLLCCSGFI